MLNELITVGGLAALFLEGLKLVIRKLMKNPVYDFDPKFYVFVLPVMNFLMIPVAAALGVDGVIMPTDWAGFLKSLVVVAVGSLISVGGYTLGIKPLKNYTKTI